ncbi:MAG: nitrilase-related carbon-nitrogen hydrolase [Planctomycetota bacterium]
MRTIKLPLLFLVTFPTLALADGPASTDCAPEYPQTVMNSYRELQFKVSVYENLPPRGKGIRLGVYQAQAAYGPGASEKNMDRLERVAHIAKQQGVQLLSFPELYVPGYTLSPTQAKQVAEFKDGPSVTRAMKIAAELNMALLVPYAEKVQTEEGLKYYDSIAVIDELGKLATSYQKTHLYGQAERNNWSFGMVAPPVVEFFGFPVGVLNCYENEFSELPRLLALRGAKLIVGPTAADNYYTLPDGDRSKVPYPDISTVLLPGFAYANNLFYAYSNRTGVEKQGENEWHYRGNSIIIGPHGDILVQAGHRQDTLLVADCIPEYYGPTHPAPGYGYLKDRRPKMYEPLVAPTADFLPHGWKYPTFKEGQELDREGAAGRSPE